MKYACLKGKKNLHIIWASQKKNCYFSLGPRHFSKRKQTKTKLLQMLIGGKFSRLPFILHFHIVSSTMNFLLSP